MTRSERTRVRQRFRLEASGDLGIGSVVSGQRHRLMNRDGSFHSERRGLPLLTGISPYHWLLEMRWPTFLLMMALGYLAINLLFAFLYLLCGAEALVGHAGDLGEGPWADMARAFFFSVQTFSTVGYGTLLPEGWWTNAIMVVQSMFGLFGIALATGLVFARFSLPRARVRFSDKAVVTPSVDGQALMFRLTNLSRKAELIELDIQVILSRFDEAGNGLAGRSFERLKLEREHVSVFPLAWTVVHPIDEQSPLAGLAASDLRDQHVEILVLLAGLDLATSQPVHTRTSYDWSEIAWNARFANIFCNQDPAAGPIAIDVGRLHDIEPTTF